MELLKDKNLEEQFHNLVKKFLTKNEDYDISRFIGGLPITLERSHVHQLMLKYPNGDYKYTVTQKVDGTRVLMYIGKDISTTPFSDWSRIVWKSVILGLSDTTYRVYLRRAANCSAYSSTQTSISSLNVVSSSSWIFSK